MSCRAYAPLGLACRWIWKIVTVIFEVKRERKNFISTLTLELKFAFCGEEL
jgi:hypothetical protein